MKMSFRRKHAKTELLTIFKLFKVSRSNTVSFFSPMIKTVINTFHTVLTRHKLFLSPIVNTLLKKYMTKNET